MLPAQELPVPHLQTPLTLSHVSSPEQAARDAVHLQAPFPLLAEVSQNCPFVEVHEDRVAVHLHTLLWQSAPVVNPAQEDEVPHLQFPVLASHVSPEGQVTDAHLSKYIMLQIR